MPSSYFPRSLEPVLRQTLRRFPAVTLTGPRQAGKTTLLRHLLDDSYRYVSLELPEIQHAASTDPRAFLAAYPPPVVFDEIQHTPVLFPYIKEHIDAHRQRTGQFVLTGSQNLLLLSRITETLAGRVAVLKLAPFSTRELAGQPDRPLPWEAGREGELAEAPAPPNLESASPFSYNRLWATLLRGEYPEIALNTEIDIGLWHSGYVQTYLERDVRSVRDVGDLVQFQTFLRTLAARNGQLLNLASISRELGLSLNTLKAWISVLETTFQVILLRPYSRNIGKRFVKTPKLYFTDIGTVCHLTGITQPEHAAAGPLAGSLMETAVLTELWKCFLHRGEEPRISFFRTRDGWEIDFIVEVGLQVVPIEVKLSATPRPVMADGLKRLAREAPGLPLVPGFVIHPGDLDLPLGEGVRALPFARL